MKLPLLQLRLAKLYLFFKREVCRNFHFKLLVMRQNTGHDLLGKLDFFEISIHLQACLLKQTLQLLL